jgi:hypothetical protein
LRLPLPKDLSYEKWAEIGPKIGRVRKFCTWALADWLCFGEFRFGETFPQGGGDDSGVADAIRPTTRSCPGQEPASLDAPLPRFQLRRMRADAPLGDLKADAFPRFDGPCRFKPDPLRQLDYGRLQPRFWLALRIASSQVETIIPTLSVLSLRIHVATIPSSPAKLQTAPRQIDIVSRAWVLPVGQAIRVRLKPQVCTLWLRWYATCR